MKVLMFFILITYIAKALFSILNFQCFSYAETWLDELSQPAVSYNLFVWECIPTSK